MSGTPQPEQPKPPHPIWRIVELSILFGGLIGIMYGNATNFDQTEVKTIATFAGLWAATAGGSSLLKRLTG